MGLGRHMHVMPSDNGMFEEGVQKVAFQAAEYIDDRICEEIGKIAAEEGITDVIVLDKRAIISAFRKTIPMKCTEEACPDCNGGIKSFSADYCPFCGQKLEWWGEEE